MYCHLVNFMWVGVVLYTAVVLVNLAIYPKMRLVAKDDFSVKIGVLLLEFGHQTLGSHFDNNVLSFGRADQSCNLP